MIDLEFCSLIEGVEDVMPIIPASQYKHEWMRTAAISMKKDGELGHVDGKDPLEFQHTSRCPGILNIKNEGYIVRTHQDIEIEVDMEIEIHIEIEIKIEIETEIEIDIEIEMEIEAL